MRELLDPDLLRPDLEPLSRGQHPFEHPPRRAGLLTSSPLLPNL